MFAAEGRHRWWVAWLGTDFFTSLPSHRWTCEPVLVSSDGEAKNNVQNECHLFHVCKTLSTVDCDWTSLRSQPNELIQAINAPMSIQISSVLCCRLSVYVWTYLNWNNLDRILNLRTVNEAKKSVKRFSNTRGAWVTDIVNEDSEELDTIQFTARSRPDQLPAAASDPEFPSPRPDGA